MSRRTALVVTAFASVYVIWGSTYLGIRIAIDTIPPLAMAGARFVLAGVMLYAFAIGRGERVADRPTGRQWRNAFIIGALLLGIGNGGVTFGEQYVASGVVALLVATVPLWFAIFAHVTRVESMNRYGMAGVVIGFLGVGLLLRPSGGDASQLPWMLFVLGAPLGWSIGSLFARVADVPSRPLVGTAMEMIGGGVLLCIAAALHGEWGQVHLQSISLRSAIAVAGLVVFGSIVAFTAYVWLLHEASPAAVSTYAYVNPLVAVLLGWAVLGEAVHPQTLLAGLLIVIAVAVILVSRSRERRTPAPATAMESAAIEERTKVAAAP